MHASAILGMLDFVFSNSSRSSWSFL